MGTLAYRRVQSLTVRPSISIFDTACWCCCVPFVHTIPCAGGQRGPEDQAQDHPRQQDEEQDEEHEGRPGAPGERLN